MTCSTPLGRWLEARWPHTRYCCLVHDARYDRGGSHRTRLAADLELFRCLLQRGVPIPVARIAYFAVRWFGWKRWGRV
jgi:hypothetical protein